MCDKVVLEVCDKVSLRSGSCRQSPCLGRSLRHVMVPPADDARTIDADSDVERRALVVGVMLRQQETFTLDPDSDVEFRALVVDVIVAPARDAHT